MQQPARISRRSILASSCAGTALYCFGLPALAQERRKLSLQEAEYKITTDGSLICAACAYFVAPKYCSIVEGEVSPKGTCKYFRDVE
jgi:hypothetical protein